MPPGKPYCTLFVSSKLRKEVKGQDSTLTSLPRLFSPKLNTHGSAIPDNKTITTLSYLSNLSKSFFSLDYLQVLWHAVF